MESVVIRLSIWKGVVTADFGDGDTVTTNESKVKANGIGSFIFRIIESITSRHVRNAEIALPEYNGTTIFAGKDISYFSYELVDRLCYGLYSSGIDTKVTTMADVYKRYGSRQLVVA